MFELLPKEVIYIILRYSRGQHYFLLQSVNRLFYMHICNTKRDFIADYLVDHEASQVDYDGFLSCLRDKIVCTTQRVGICAHLIHKYLPIHMTLLCIHPACMNDRDCRTCDCYVYICKPLTVCIKYLMHDRTFAIRFYRGEHTDQIYCSWIGFISEYFTELYEQLMIVCDGL